MPASSRDSHAHISSRSGSNLLEGFCFDLLVHELTFAAGSVEGSHKLLNVSDRIGVLATASEGDEDLTISGGAHGLNGGGSECVDHN